MAFVAGCVYAERVDHDSERMEEDAETTHECIDQFDEFTVWKHDSAPDTKTDPFFVAMEWSNIATHVRLLSFLESPLRTLC
jgi:hypothetical protein